MRTPRFPIARAHVRLATLCAAASFACGGVAAAEEKPPPATDLPAVLTQAQMAYIDAKDESEKRIREAESKRAKLLFMEQQKRGTVLAFAIPQPKPEEIQSFLVPLKEIIANSPDERCRAWAKERISMLGQRHGFRKGKLRAVYLLIPANREESLLYVSFAAETEEEGERFIREDLKPVKWEIGKSYQAREGFRASIREIHKGWNGEELVKGRGLDAQLENWVNWNRKRSSPK